MWYRKWRDVAPAVGNPPRRSLSIHVARRPLVMSHLPRKHVVVTLVRFRCFTSFENIVDQDDHPVGDRKLGSQF